MSYTPENETAIAYWTRPQFITVSGKTNIGVAAYALDDMIPIPAEGRFGNVAKTPT